MMGEARHEMRAIFTTALALSTPAERARYLDTACRDKPELRERVEALLRAHEQAGRFLEVNGPEAEALREGPGTVIGRYRLLEEIGEGAFGRVFMAEQTEPVSRKVALKIIKAGMDTREVIARFEAERQALALMDHPNIAKVFDAGATDTGRPYFVMELVRGIAITTYCDQEKLSTTGRLRLFMQVCHAVQHAHQKGVIHRDLKPTNILVTLIDGEPVPKVIDFGVAKAIGQKLTEKTLFTAFQQMIGTPAYMSPEQATLSGTDVDTRSDIYSLGVLLYELLTGVTPFDQETFYKAALDEICRLIRETEPPKPSTRLHALVAADERRLKSKSEIQNQKSGPDAASSRRLLQTKETIRLIRGDLDWIVMKCLEKDRARRYETATSLAEDVERHLKLEPVKAAAPSVFYRARKFIHRYRAGVAMVAALVFLLVAGAVVSTWQAVRAWRAERAQTELRQRAEANEKKAQAEADKSLEIIQFLNSMLNGAGESLAQGRERTLPREILDQTADRIVKELKNQPDVEVKLLVNVGGIYQLLGEDQKAEAMHRQALAIERKMFGEEHLEVAQSLNDLAWVLRDESKLAEAETACRQALAIRRKLLGEAHSDVAQSLTALAWVLMDQYKPAEAEEVCRQALAVRRKLLGEEHAEVAASLYTLAWALDNGGKPAEAESLFRQALATQRKLLGEEHRDVAWSLHGLAWVLREEGKPAEAESLFRQALAMRRKLLGEEHGDVAWSLYGLAWALQDQGKPAEAESLFRQALTMRRKLLGEEHREVARSINDLACALHGQFRLAEAETMFQQALAMRRKLLGEEHPEVPQTLAQLAVVLREEGRLTEAEAVCRQALAMRRKIFGEEHREVAQSLADLAFILHSQGRLVEAETFDRQALEIRTKLLGEEHPEVAQSLAHLGEVLRSEGRLSEAETVCRQALAIRTKLFGGEHLEVSFSLSYLTWLLHDRDKLAEAETAGRQALAIKRKILGENHQLAVSALADLAWVLADEDRPAEAAALFREGAETGNPEAMDTFAWFLATCEDPNVRDGSNAVRVAEKAVTATGRGNPSYLDTLAAAFAASGQFTNAIRFQQEAIALLQGQAEKEDYSSRLKLYQSGSPYRDDNALATRTQAMLMAGKFAEAEPLARECLAIREKQIPDAWRAFNARSMLGGTLLGQGKYAEAEPLLLAGYEGMKQREDKIPANGKVRLKESLQRLVQLYDATGRADKAAEWKQKLAEFERVEAGELPTAPR